MLKALELAAPQLFPFLIEASIKVIGIAFLFIPLQVGVPAGTYFAIFNVMGLPVTAGFAIAFLRRIRSLVVASVGSATLALLTRDVRIGCSARNSCI